MYLTNKNSTYKKLRALEKEPYVRAARKWLRKERKHHYGPLCLPLGDDLYLTAKGFALDTGTAPDILPLIPDSYSLMRLSSPRVALMKELQENFGPRRSQRDDKIRNISTQTNIQYVGALEIPTFVNLASYAAYLFLLPAAPFISSAVELRLFRKSHLFRSGPVQKLDPILARAGCKKGHTATTKQLGKAFFGH